MISVSVKHTSRSQLNVTAELELSSKQMKLDFYWLFLFFSPGMRRTSRLHKSWMTCQNVSKWHPICKAEGKMCCAASCPGRLRSLGPKPKQALLSVHKNRPTHFTTASNASHTPHLSISPWFPLFKLKLDCVDHFSNVDLQFHVISTDWM